MKDHDYRDDVPPFDLPGIRKRLKRLQELATRFSVESLYVCQRRVPLKPDEIKAYSRAMLEAFRAMNDAKRALETVEARLTAIQARGR